MGTLSIEYRDIEELIPYARNARTHSDEQVAQIAGSIREFGFTNPVLIDEGGIIAGHGRIMAARKLGLKEVPTIPITGLSEAQKKALILADNKMALNAGWDDAMLQVELEQLEKEGFDLNLTGFSEKEYEDLINEFREESESMEHEDDIPEAPTDPVTSPGDVWLLGEHRLLCGDSTKAEDLEKLMNSELADLWITDPPYNVAYQGRTEKALTIQNDSMSSEDFKDFLVKAFYASKAFLKAGSSFYIWYSFRETINFYLALQEVNLKIREDLIWVKQHFVVGGFDYHYKHEPCLYGWVDGAPHKWYSDRTQTTVLEFDKPNKNLDHPTMKPVELFKYLILNSSKHGDIVLDSFGGSGTTLIACEQLERKARLIELDPVYCDVIVTRWQDLTGKQAVREKDGLKFDDLKGGK